MARGSSCFSKSGLRRPKRRETCLCFEPLSFGHLQIHSWTLAHCLLNLRDLTSLEKKNKIDIVF